MRDPIPGHGAAGEGLTRADRARRVAQVLRGQVLRGAFPGGVLPDERALIAEFGTTRNTVREALGLLRDEGLVERRRGVGTVVVGRTYRHPLGELSGLAEVLQRHGTVVNEVREAQAVRPPGAVARRLGLAEGEPAVYLERLRRVDGTPLSLDCTYLIPEVGEPLLARGRGALEGQDVFDLIERGVGLPLGRAEVSVQAVVADPATCAVLAMPEGGAVLAVERLTRLADGRPADLEFIQLRGDRLTLHATLDRARGTGTGPARPA
ncbi:GntR family transcriptional regulator [Streptomyces natalensis]|uniref:GntR family transcriptional regulator n=1 Tax=Streptomyces natalensis ATCC 27448 TaxID=1240678 RepID=A0A0D7CT72_9ACTN|nr:GntR family transcriptional regulator [Streptomyces natalensis]KIZ19226.1 GntR family transcriptional regulator [Streptomyces natalensis ATCC 27448]